MNVEDTLSHIDATLDGADWADTLGMPDAMHWAPDPPPTSGEEVFLIPDHFTIVHVDFDPWRAVSHPIAETCDRCPVPAEVWAEVRAMPPLSALFTDARRRLTRSNPT